MHPDVAPHTQNPPPPSSSPTSTTSFPSSTPLTRIIMGAPPPVNKAIFYALPPAEARHQLAHVYESRVDEITVAQIICVAIAATAVLLRFFARWLQRTRFGPDDWTVLVSLILQGGVTAAVLLAVKRYGGGRHAILLQDPVKFAKSVLVAEALYAPSIALVKISTCFLFARIFPQPRFRWFLVALGTFVALYSTIQVILSIFQCRPINGAWDVTIGARCIEISLVWEIFGGMNVLTDIALLLAPLPQLWKLQMPRQTKAQLFGIFCVGGFVLVVSVYRIPKIHGLSMEDASWSDADTSIWSTVEVCVAIACGCAITYRPLFHRALSPVSAKVKSISQDLKRSQGSHSWPDDEMGLQNFEAAKIPQDREQYSTEITREDSQDLKSGQDAIAVQKEVLVFTSERR